MMAVVVSDAKDAKESGLMQWKTSLLHWKTGLLHRKDNLHVRECI